MHQEHTSKSASITARVNVTPERWRSSIGHVSISFAALRDAIDHPLAKDVSGVSLCQDAIVLTLSFDKRPDLTSRIDLAYDVEAFREAAVAAVKSFCKASGRAPEADSLPNTPPRT